MVYKFFNVDLQKIC